MLVHFKPPLLGLVLFFLIIFCFADRDKECPKSTPLVGLEYEFTMVQHQLRGVFSLIDDCSFKVKEFDMLAGTDVYWWSTMAPNFGNLTKGFIVSDQKLNQTYKNASFTVRLFDNLTWDQIPVLAIWDVHTASSFGHVVLNASDLEPTWGLDMPPLPEQNRIQMMPTMFDNCKELAKNYRIRWSLDVDQQFIDIGLEAAIGIQKYMAFGWADPSKGTGLMLGSDVVVTGFTEEGRPFADDFFISDYSECSFKKDGSVSGVCPDSVYQRNGPVGLTNNSKAFYGLRKDGVSFIRYRRPLISDDKKYDISVNYTDNMTVIWAMGLMRPPDALRPFYLPQNHGGPKGLTYGHLVLNLSEHENNCLGPLDADDKEDQDLVIADAKAPLVVVTGDALHYPNPPNPPKVFYINKKEAPVLRVERGVPVKFSIQAGHDVALYITSDLLGGNATLRNRTETIYAGGPEAEGVPSSPKELVWAPDRNTPDQVYYQSVFQQKMGWRIEVVDGGLPDMYNNSVVLDDQQVTFFWTLSKDKESISLAARAEKKSNYLAIGFGTSMVNSYAYVGWIDSVGKGHVNTYWIDGMDASSVHPTNENLTYVRCKSENGIITFEFTRPLKPPCPHKHKPECKNIIDPTTPLKVIWAMGSSWTDEHLTEKNMHFVKSQRPVRVLLLHGSAEAEQDLRPVLAVHGFMMFLAWGIVLPGGILAARYLKHVKGDGWYQIHVYLQYSGLAIVLLALLFAVAELRGFYVSSLHVKFGITAIVFACVQPVNACIRPKKPDNSDVVSPKRLMWEYFHVIVGRSAIVVGIAALFSGMKHLGDRYGGENVHGLIWALVIWFLICGSVVVYLELCQKQRRRERVFERSNWVLGNVEEDDSADLLSPTRDYVEKGPQQSGRLEVQLEPLNR
ncbi:cytochrome b561, DM13 and DOMON domain-containing protein At5g54830-like [Pistacia vera]|uniref:cytochrome b561, DM13 and DOMON domain-containing protein At5g54830-like n=1 Tax=Pistacia vera TaxID=55513 RepID=UPI001263634D|nr:cytochrome b561, DM13 and DOMON domain-containing protein At5g54830-like [Pistacia vera]